MNIPEIFNSEKFQDPTYIRITAVVQRQIFTADKALGVIKLHTIHTELFHLEIFLVHLEFKSVAREFGHRSGNDHCSDDNAQRDRRRHHGLTEINIPEAHSKSNVIF